MRYQQQHDEHDVEQWFFYFVTFGFKPSHANVDDVLGIGIVEVAQEPPLDTVDEVHNTTLDSSFSKEREVSFHGRCSRVKHANDICILSPADPEVLFELVGEFLESPDAL